MAEGGVVQGEDDDLLDLLPVVRRVIGARVRDPHLVDDLVQETLTRMMAARSRVEAETLVPYAIATARNLIATHAERQDRERRKAHLVADVEVGLSTPEDEVLLEERRSVVGEALDRLPPGERELLVAHEVEGADTYTLAASRGSTPGAVAAQLNRSRAKLRVEVLLGQAGEPPTDRCRPVLIALSGGDRRRQRQLDCAGHLLDCEFCADLSPTLLDRRAGSAANDGARVGVTRDADVVTARQKGREIAVTAGFSATEATLIATVISELARNIVQFAERGEILAYPVEQSGRKGVMIVARDVGPGIRDVDRALQDGYSSYRGGLGLGLPGSRRLMDEFEIISEVGKGTTVTLTKWLRG